MIFMYTQLVFSWVSPQKSWMKYDFSFLFSFDFFDIPLWLISMIRRCLGVGDLYSTSPLLGPTGRHALSPDHPHTAYIVKHMFVSYNISALVTCVRFYGVHVVVCVAWMMHGAPDIPNSGLPWLPAQGDTAWSAIGTYVNTHEIFTTLAAVTPRRWRPSEWLDLYYTVHWQLRYRMFVSLVIV